MIRNAGKRLTFAALLGAAVAGMFGCNLFEDSSTPTAPSAALAPGTTGNYILSDAESGDWAAYYTPGDTYFKATIPVSGAMAIRYTVVEGAQAGRSFTIFLKTTKPLTHEIGLKTINGVTDVVECVTVEYVEQGEFAEMPGELVIEEQGDGYIQYERKTGDSETEEWWPEADAAKFVMSATPQRKTLFCGGQTQVEQGQPANHPGAMPVAPPAGSYTVTATTSGTGAGTVAGASVHAAGTNVTLTATANTGSYFVQWTSGPCANSTTATCAFTINADVTADAQFDLIPATMYTITATAGANGSISPAGSVTVAKGATQTFELIPEYGYVVADVRVDGLSQSVQSFYPSDTAMGKAMIGLYTFDNINTDHEIIVTFEKAIILYSGDGLYTGNLGGRSGADEKCRNSALKPGGYSNYHAFLSVTSDDEIRDMPTNYGVPTNVRVKSPDNFTVFAMNWADLLDGSIPQSLRVAGVFPSNDPPFAWAGSLNDGSISWSCNAWTMDSGFAGDLAQIHLYDNWLASGRAYCEYPLPIMCIAY